jgi:hypothetical protein
MRDLDPYREAIKSVVVKSAEPVREGLISAAYPELEDDEFDRALRCLVHAGWIRRERGYVWKGDNYHG